MSSETDIDTPARGITTYAWYVAVVLGLAQLISVVDIYLIAMFIEHVKTDMSLSDAQIGVIVGPAFVFLFVALCLPAGRAADSLNRRLFIAAGVTVWSLATVWTGLARSFGELVAARLLTGLGEATLVPSALSLIAAYFPDRLRYRGTAVFTSGLSLGRATAFLGGGALLAYLATLGPLHLPIYGYAAPWRVVILTAGIVGLVIALLVLTIREPKRQADIEKPQFMAAWRHFTSHWRMYVPLMVGFSCGAVISSNFALWSVSFAVREWAMPLQSASIAFGLCSLFLGPLGHMLGGWFGDKLHSLNIDTPWLWTLLLMLLVEPILALCFWQAPSFPLVVLAYGLAYLSVSSMAPQSFGGIQVLTPPQHLGVVSALFVMFYQTIGSGLGPYAIGVISTWSSKGGGSLGQTMVIVTCSASLVGLCFVGTALWQAKRSAPTLTS